MVFLSQSSDVDRGGSGERAEPTSGLIQITGSQEVDSFLEDLRYALHNVFLLVVVAAGLTLTINLFSWVVGGPGLGYEDYAGYQGYLAPGEILLLLRECRDD